MVAVDYAWASSHKCEGRSSSFHLRRTDAFVRSLCGQSVFPHEIHSCLEKITSWAYVSAYCSAARALAREGKLVQWTQAAEDHLFALHCQGAATGGELLGHIDVHCQKEMELLLAVGCAGRLAEANRLSLDHQCLVLYKVACRLKRLKWQDFSCDRLQPLVDAVVKNVGQLPNKLFVKALSGAAWLSGVKVTSLMNTADAFYSAQLRNLGAGELLLLIEASRIVSARHDTSYSGNSLCLDILDEYKGRVQEFSPTQCLHVLRSMLLLRFGPEPTRNLLQDVLRKSEQHLAGSVDTLSENQIALLSSMFYAFAYTAQSIPFKKIMVQRWHKFSPDVLVKLMTYLCANGLVDNAILDRLCHDVQNEILALESRDICRLVVSVIKVQQHHPSPSGQTLLLLLVDKVSEMCLRTKVAFAAPDLVLLFNEFIRMKGLSHDLMKYLFTAALSSFPDLPCSYRAAFFYAVTLSPSAYIIHFCKVFPPGKLSFTHLKVDSMKLVVGGFVRLRFCEAACLQHIANLCYEQLPWFMDHDISNMASILHDLAFLRISHPKLYLAVKDFLEKKAASNMLQSSLSLCKLVWACAIQGHLPVTTTKYLCSQLFLVYNEAKVLHSMLLDINALWRSVNGDNLFTKERYNDLVRLAASSVQQTTDKGVYHKALDQMLPRTHLQYNLIVEAVKITCALLKNANGQTVPWPHSPHTWVSSEGEACFRMHGGQPVAILIYKLRGIDLEPYTECADMVMERRRLESIGWLVLSLISSQQDTVASVALLLQLRLAQFGVQIQQDAWHGAS